MSKQNDNYKSLAIAVGLQYDAAKDVIHGYKGGFEFIIYAADKRYPYMLTIQTAAKGAIAAELSKEEKKEIVKSIDKIAGMNQKGYVITFQQTNIGNQEKLRVALGDSLAGIANGLRNKGYNPCCGMCGQSVETAAFQSGSSYLHICSDCEINLRNQAHLSEQAEAQKKENVVGGIVGAFIGSLLGILCIVILSRMGYVAALSGVAMAIGVMKGYEMLGKKISKKGVVFCVIIMLFMTYVGDRLDWAIYVASEWKENVFDCYRAIPALISEGYIETGNYVGNLVLLYVFLLLGAVPTIAGAVGEQKVKNTLVKIGSYSTNDYSQSM
uniref:hypothetical protein n=1 Tax=Acetatifactor sp. TaxID=1872090 RepID=UPI004056ECDC